MLVHTFASRLAAALTFAWLLAASSGACAQVRDVKLDLRIAPELALTFASPTAGSPVTTAPVDERAALARELRRSRAFIAAGVGMLISGAVGMGWGANACSDPDDPSHNVGFLAGGAAVFGAGLAFTLRGRARKARTRRVTDWWPALPFLTLATMLTASALWFTAGVGEWVECLSS